VITAGDKPLLIVKFSKSSSCGNVTSVGCAPLVTVILSERTTSKAGRKVWFYVHVFNATSLVTDVLASPIFPLDRRMPCSLVFRDRAVAR